MLNLPFGYGASLLWAIALLVLVLGLMYRQQLGLTLPLLTAIARSLLQLTVLGALIGALWQTSHPGLLLLALVLMVTLAAIAARQRINHSGRFILPWIWGAMFLSTGAVLAYIAVFVLQGQIGLVPQFWLPLAGLAFHHTLSTLAITGEQLIQQMTTNRSAIETYLCLGASPQAAIAPYRRAAMRAGLLPTVNTMTVLGLASLPTLMAGQLLSGTAPLEAAINQFLILLLLVCVTFLSSMILVWGLSRQFFNRFDQLIDDSF